MECDLAYHGRVVVEGGQDLLRELVGPHHVVGHSADNPAVGRPVVQAASLGQKKGHGARHEAFTERAGGGKRVDVLMLSLGFTS